MKKEIRIPFPNRELINAVIRGDKDQIKETIRSGADIDKKPGERSFQLAIELAGEKGWREEFNEIAQLLINYGANPSSNDNLPLISAAQLGNFEMVKFLLEQKCVIEGNRKEIAVNEALNFGYPAIADYITNYHYN